MRSLALFMLVAGVIATGAQPVCRVFKNFNAVANTGMLQDTIVVPDNFPVASATVSRLALGHPDVAGLQLALLHRATPEAAFTTAALKPMADALGAYRPEAAVSASSAGQWIIRVTDSQPGAEQRVISLASWTLQLCPSDTPVSAADGSPQVSVGVSSSGVSVNVSSASNDGKAQDKDGKDDSKATDRSMKVGDHAKSMLELLFPGLKADAAPEGVLGVISTVKDAGRQAVSTHIGDTLKLVADSSEVYKNYVNKKITDTIGVVNTAGTATQGIIANKGGLFGAHDKSLLGFLHNLKTAVAADAQDKVESVLTAASQLSSLSGAITGDLKSSAGLVVQLVGAALGNTFKLYTTAEGAAKTHIDNSISAKAAVLEGLLDKVIAGLSAAKESKLTGPAVDFKIDFDVAKLQLLAAALNKVDDAVKALPTPSGFVLGKASAVGNFWRQTRVAELLSLVHDGPIMGRLTDKINTAKDLLKKATAPVVATSGN